MTAAEPGNQPILQAALDYAQRGWPVFPCAPAGKQPLIPKNRGGNGLHDATTDPDTITAWWARTPDANIGLRTGIAFDVLDIDGPEGAHNIVAACEHNDWQLPPGPWSNTGGGGTHILFAPTGSGNRAGILPKVDWRGVGGYIIAPPSIHPDGPQYHWALDGGPDLPPEPVPQWLADILTPPTLLHKPAGPVKFLPLAAGEGTPYGLQALERELDDLARSQPGTRNDSLNSAAFNLYQLVAGGELRELIVTERLRTVALSIGLPEREANTTLHSARGKGMQRPRSAPELTVITGGRTLTPTPTGGGTPAADDQPAKILEILTAAELVHQVETAPPVGWLIRGLFPADAHGVLAAEQKAGKTWANLDLVVSVASGTPWLGHLAAETQGPVLVFLGEGGMRKMKRRLDAICETRGVHLADLPIRFCFRVPHLAAIAHLAALAEEIEATKPALVIIDPLYLAARGAKTSQLNEMGEHLENVQRIAQRHGAALIIIHHWNKTGEGKGAKRMTGTGGAEWGRVLISMSVRTKTTDKHNKATTAIVDLEFEGDEIPETELRFRRRIWSDDPDDLAAAMHYEVGAVARDEDDDQADMLQHPGLSPAARRIHAALVAANNWLSVRDIGDRLAHDGNPLKSRTIQTALKELEAESLAHPWGSAGQAHSWCATEATDELGTPLHTTVGETQK